MKPGMFHRVCAHPVTLAWVLLAVGTNMILLTQFVNAYSWSALLLDPATMFWLGLLCGITGLVCLIPAGMLYMPISSICARYNGSPLRLGDQVCILTGKYRGAVVSVDRITHGQGGWPLVKLAFGTGYRPASRDFFEEHRLLRINRRLT